MATGVNSNVLLPPAHDPADAQQTRTHRNRRTPRPVAWAFVCGGGGNRTRVRQRGSRTSPGAVCCGVSQPRRSRRRVVEPGSVTVQCRVGPRDRALRQWPSSRRQRPGRRPTRADGHHTRSGGEGDVGARCIGTYGFATIVDEMTSPPRPASPGTTTDVETCHPLGVAACRRGHEPGPATVIDPSRPLPRPRRPGGWPPWSFNRRAPPGCSRRRRGRRDQPRGPATSAVGAQAHGAVGLAAVLTLTQGLPLVVVLLAARDADLDLDPAVLEVQRERDDRQPLLARHRRDLLDLVAVQQQLAPPARLVVRPGALGVLGDVALLQPHLARVGHRRERVSERRAARPERLHLGAHEYDAGLVDVVDVVVVPRLAVGRDDLAAALPGHDDLPTRLATTGTTGGPNDPAYVTATARDRRSSR